jgi:tripartite ATP-independent transporter DctM subunit
MNILAISILIGSLFLLLLFRVPIAFALGISASLTMMYLGLPLMNVAHNLVKGVNSFSLLAIPFFILAGEIMGQGGISKRLIMFSNIIVGRMRGGLAMVNVLSSMFFGGISGSSVADTSSIGSIMIPMMEEQGYDKDYAVNVTITSSTQGIIIPPSHNMIIYSMAAGGLSIGKLFLGGMIPGILLGITLMVLSYVIAVMRKYPKGDKVGLKQALKVTRDSILGLFTAVIIVGGVLSGHFTATESAAIATVYAFVITFFVYRDIPLKQMIDILKKSVHTLAIVLSVISSSAIFAWLMAYLKVPELITTSLLGISDNKYVLLIIVNVVLLLLGMIMDMAPLIMIATPILLPVTTSIGMDPIQFGVVMLLNLGIGLITPPVGATLFVGCSIGKISIEKIAKSLIPFYIVFAAYVLLITFIPQITLFLPNLLMK